MRLLRDLRRAVRAHRLERVRLPDGVGADAAVDLRRARDEDRGRGIARRAAASRRKAVPRTVTSIAWPMSLDGIRSERDRREVVDRLGLSPLDELARRTHGRCRSTTRRRGPPSAWPPGASQTSSPDASRCSISQRPTKPSAPVTSAFTPGEAPDFCGPTEPCRIASSRSADIGVDHHLDQLLEADRRLPAELLGAPCSGRRRAGRPRPAGPVAGSTITWSL